MDADISYPIYWLTALFWSAYQGYRGTVEMRLVNREKDWFNSVHDRWVVLYIHDFAFRFICTFAGFVALYACDLVIEGLGSFNDVSAGTGTFLVAGFLIAVVGIGGQLHHVILLGKVPRAEK